jgi:anti-anti-sigma regulatory factor
LRGPPQDGHGTYAASSGGRPDRPDWFVAYEPGASAVVDLRRSTIRLVIDGELDAGNHRQVLGALRGALRDLDELIPGRQWRWVEVDASGIRLLSAGALAGLLDVVRDAHRRGAAFRLIDPQPPVERVLGITGLRRRLGVIAGMAASGAVGPLERSVVVTARSGPEAWHRIGVAVAIAIDDDAIDDDAAVDGPDWRTVRNLVIHWACAGRDVTLDASPALEGRVRAAGLAPFLASRLDRRPPGTLDLTG